NGLRQVLNLTKVQQLNSQNAIIVRDTPDKLAIARRLLKDIDKAKPEVLIQVEVLWPVPIACATSVFYPASPLPSRSLLREPLRPPAAPPRRLLPVLPSRGSHSAPPITLSLCQVPRRILF